MTFPKALLVYKPFARAVLTGDLVVPRARALGLSATTVSGHVYAPSLECLIWTGGSNHTDRGRNYLWMDKLSGVNWDNVDCIQHDTEAYLSGQWVTQLSNVRSIDYFWRYDTNKKFGNLAVQSVSGLHLPYVRALSSLMLYSGVSDLQMPQLFYVDRLILNDVTGDMTVSLPGLETDTFDKGIPLNGYMVKTN